MHACMHACMHEIAHQVNASNHVGHDGLRAEADQDARDAAQRQQRGDVDTQHVQAGDAAKDHDQPAG